MRDAGDSNRAVFSDTLVVIGDIFNGKNGNADNPNISWPGRGSAMPMRARWRSAFTIRGWRAIHCATSSSCGFPASIYPDKPIITDIGRDFTVMANGNYDSSTSPSIPSEGYWNAGWPGVALFALLLSTVLTLWSIYSTIVFDRDAWHLLLVVLLGMRVGTRIDGFLVPDVVGPLSAVLAIHIACTLANRFLPRIPALQRRFVA